MHQRSASSVLPICLLAALSGLSMPAVTAAQPVSVEKAPYLIFQGDSTGMQLLWQLSDVADCIIEWGTDTTYSLGSAQTAEFGADHQHTYTIGGLTPGATYFYRVLAAGEVYSGFFEAGAADLATSLKFLALHEPGWSAGGDHSNEVPVQLCLQPLCVQYGVSVVFGGHNHDYARAVVDGVRHVTTGGGGAPLQTPDSDSPHVVAAAAAHHFCKVAVGPELLEFVAVTPEGEILDSFTVDAPTPVADATSGCASRSSIWRVDAWMS